MQAPAREAEERSLATAILDAPIDDPSAWTAASLGGRRGLERRFPNSAIDALVALASRTRGLPRRDVGRAQFDHPDLTPFLFDLQTEIQSGACAAIVSGIDAAAHTLADLEGMFWGVGAHLGEAAVQSRRADRIGYVRHEPGDGARGYRSSDELTLHTDSRPVIALMCVSAAERGGLSRLASATTVHNVIRRERPDLLAPLYRGYPYYSGEIDALLPTIPVFSAVDGALSCYFFEAHMRKAAVLRGEALPADLEEAIAFFKDVCERKDVSLDFMLAPGEILISNNFVVLHARTAFEDSERRRRLLLRLWLSPSPARPTIPQLMERSERFDALFDR